MGDVISGVLAASLIIHEMKNHLSHSGVFTCAISPGLDQFNVFRRGEEAFRAGAGNPSAEIKPASIQTYASPHCHLQKLCHFIHEFVQALRPCVTSQALPAELFKK